jgi:oxygen-independent coproporphyrinogen III oxidase
MVRNDLIKKYDVPVPRYTSYPTVPYWDTDKFSKEDWWSAVKLCFDESNTEKGISLYVHLPFCESLCTYCACNTRITRNHKVEENYITAVLAEWGLYKQKFDNIPVIRELHLGGGTPTFFSPENLSRLINGLLEGCEVHQDHQFSFEGHPNNTTFAHLQALYSLGFSRVSFGVQDLDEKVQKAIHRIQPLENLESATRHARTISYDSISYDLIYGLPYQTVATITKTIGEIIKLRPGRIAFYSYAHVPWMKPGQRGYEDADLPTDVMKRSLYETGRRLLNENGYVDVGMDHFALMTDSLAQAMVEGKLHRNFMGYTTTATDLLIGLGASSISDAKYAYAQNEKKVEDYQQRVLSSQLAIFKGHLQTSEDVSIKKCILDIACRGKLDESSLKKVHDPTIEKGLDTFENEGLLERGLSGFRLTEDGYTFLRNVCHLFDKRSRRIEKVNTPIFSRAI